MLRCLPFPPAQIQIMTITREFLVMARHNLIPSWFAYVNGYTGTPLRITLIFGVIKGAPPIACLRPWLSLEWGAGPGRGNDRLARDPSPGAA